MQEIPTDLKGNFTAEIYTAVSGGTDFTQGQGADMVPTSVGSGQTEVNFTKDTRASISNLPECEKLLCTIEGVSPKSDSTIRAAVEFLEKDGRAVTKENVLSVLNNETPEIQA